LIVNDGKLQLLGFEIPDLETCLWGLFTNNFTIAPTTVLADLVEAAWTGYARATVGTLAAPSLVSNVAVTTPGTNPTFTNTSGVAQGFFGWFLVDPTGLILMAAVNLGSTTIPDGGIFPLAPTITDNQA
jgi:hypothetical protein